MPVTLAQIAARQASASFSWEGETVTVTYRPGLVTDALMAQLDAGSSERNDGIASLLMSWDVLADDGSMYPFDADSLAHLDKEFKDTVMFAMLNDMRSRPNSTATKTQS